MFKNKQYDYDLIVIGSGAGGGVGAHTARALGKSVAIFEADAIGGECPTYACVPTKALIHAAHIYNETRNSKLFGVDIPKATLNYAIVKKWKDLVVSRTGASHGAESFKKDGIDLIRKKAVFISPHEVEAGGKIYSASKFIVAAGSKEFIPPIVDLEKVGYITFKQAINLTKAPKSLLIFGGGAVGCEFAHLFSSFGVKVTMVIRSDKLLGKEDKEVSELVKALFEQQGVTILTETTAVKVEKKKGMKIVHFQKKDKEFFGEFDEILMATGKVPKLNFSPEKAGISTEKGRLPVNSYLQTNVSHIYAAGDIVGPYLFTHTGYYQSYIAAHNAFSREKKKVDYRVVPRCVFITPEVASVGMGEKEAAEKGIKTKKGIMALAILGRSNTSNNFDGFVKIVTDKYGVIIGGSIVAPRAGEMIHEIALAIKCRVTAEELSAMIHAYPTYSEGVKIAASLVEL